MVLDFFRDHGFITCYFTLFWGAIAGVTLSALFPSQSKPMLAGAVLLITVWIILTFGIAFVPRMTIPFK